MTEVDESLTTFGSQGDEIRRNRCVRVGARSGHQWRLAGVRPLTGQVIDAQMRLDCLLRVSN